MVLLANNPELMTIAGYRPRFFEEQPGETARLNGFINDNQYRLHNRPLLFQEIRRFTRNPAITVSSAIPSERVALQLVLERVVTWDDYLPAVAQPVD